MLSDFPVHPTLPATDLERARAFYEGRLGLVAQVVLPGGVIYGSADGTILTVFPTSGRSSGSHTQASWQVTGIEAVVADLTARGVVFEAYDFPTLKTVDGIAQTGPNRAAWFKDSEGNLLGLIEFAEPV